MEFIFILAMHGMPPSDFPKKDLMEFFGLHERLKAMPTKLPPTLQSRYKELELKLRNWSRTPENDPYQVASCELAQALQTQLQYPVYVGFNEFCYPSLDEILEQASQERPQKIVVLTVMLTRGGEHSERDIPMAIESAQRKFPDIQFLYLWPFEILDLAHFLVDQIKKKYFSS